MDQQRPQINVTAFTDPAELDLAGLVADRSSSRIVIVIRSVAAIEAPGAGQPAAG
ncbi:hypothetical protein [Burkholderia contaminans]|uniref:hypothetical protein n=1 Tax=Burkholderia contaminans TaxID=488447 RepID=UPI0016257DDC|nr:hypothetical protein [Burkholderia contaminans]